MKKIFTLLTIYFFSVIGNNLTAQTCYASVTSGSWGTNATWETYSSFSAALAGSTGSGTAASSVPSGTHDVLIRTGHTINMGAANRGCKGIIIQTGGTLYANETTARRLQIGQGGTGFVYPLVDTVQVDGVLGAPNDGVYIETGTAAQTVNLTGGGSIDILRIRTIGGATGGTLNFNISTNINLWQSANYALTAVYNPAITDNYTLTIASGKIVTIKAVDGTFHNSQNSTTYGIYKYNINGTLDVSANTQPTNNTSANIVAPSPAASKVTLSIDGGTLKLGSSFKADTSNTTPQSLGILDFRLVNSGILDATSTTNFKLGKTSDGSGGFRDLVFGTDATISFRQTVGSSAVRFPVGVTGTFTTNAVSITNSGISDVFSVNVNSNITNTPPNANVVNRQWIISEAVVGGTVGTIGLSWITADQAAGFDPAATVSILRWTGSAYEPHTATVTGTGTVNDPYVATATGFVAFSPFIVANFSVLPISFSNTAAYQKNAGVQIDWSISNDNNASNYVIERSGDGGTFNAIGNVNAQSTGTALANYSFFDANPFNGNNFYRIKAIDKDGSVKYTSILKVNLGSGKADVVIAPNPVTSKQVILQMNNMSKGTYTANLYNIAGQNIYSYKIKTDGGSSTQTLQLPANVKTGIYNLQISNGADVKLNKTFIVE